MVEISIGYIFILFRFKVLFTLMPWWNLATAIPRLNQDTHLTS